MTEIDLPPAYDLAAQLARDFERSIDRLDRIEAVLLIAPPVVATVAVLAPDRYSHLFAAIIAMTIGVGFANTVLARNRRRDGTGREAMAIADSVESMAWYYMMRSGRFEDDLPGTDDAFI